jgi:hypothetical protein
MRLIRLGALVGSVVLLVATSVSMVNNRSELRSEQDARVTATVLLANQSVESTIARAAAVVDVANESTDPAALVGSFGDDVSACISSGDEVRCTDVDLFALSAFGTAAAASVQLGAPALVVDETTDSLLVVSRQDVTTALRLPIAALVNQGAAATIVEYEAQVDIELSATPADGVGRNGPLTVDDRRVITDTLAVPNDGGSVRVTASVADDVGSSAMAPPATCSCSRSAPFSWHSRPGRSCSTGGRSSDAPPPTSSPDSSTVANSNGSRRSRCSRRTGSTPVSASC